MFAAAELVRARLCRIRTPVSWSKRSSTRSATPIRRRSAPRTPKAPPSPAVAASAWGFNSWHRMVLGLLSEWRSNFGSKPAKKMAGVSTPGKPAGPKPTPASTPAPTGKLSRGERNNNPGNLENGNFTRSQPGYIGSDGRFAKFKTPQDGENAQVNLLRKNYAGMSVAQIIQKYAPLGDNSEASVRNYIGYVASRAGVNPDAKLGDGHYQQVAAAMRAFETGKRGPLKFQPYGGQLTRAGSSGGTGGGGGNVPQINYQPSSVPGPSGRPNTGVVSINRIVSSVRRVSWKVSRKNSNPKRGRPRQSLITTCVCLRLRSLSRLNRRSGIHGRCSAG